jgi:hypothetical protein
LGNYILNTLLSSGFSEVFGTAYLLQSLMKSNQVSMEAKEELKGVYLGLNPAELKRGIEAKLDKLYRVYTVYFLTAPAQC